MGFYWYQNANVLLRVCTMYRYEVFKKRNAERFPGSRSIWKLISQILVETCCYIMRSHILQNFEVMCATFWDMPGSKMRNGGNYRGKNNNRMPSEKPWRLPQSNKDSILKNWTRVFVWKKMRKIENLFPLNLFWHFLIVKSEGCTDTRVRRNPLLENV